MTCIYDPVYMTLCESGIRIRSNSESESGRTPNPNPAELRIRIRPNSESESGRTPNPNSAELRIRIRPNSESESGRNPNPNLAELRNLVGDLRIARIDPSRGGGIKETRVDLFLMDERSIFSILVYRTQKIVKKHI